MKKILIILAGTAGLIIVVFLLISYLNHLHVKSQESYLENHYIFDKNFPPKKTKTDTSHNKYLSHDTATPETLKLFRFLEQRFAEKSLNELGEHFNKVRHYLYAQFKTTDAQRLFEIYQKYLECQIAITNSSKYQLATEDPRHILRLLFMAHNLRRDEMGRENADMLFGSEVKENEYLLRRAMIIGDSTLYGKEKESRLQTLKRDMWGDKAISIGEDKNPYNRYQLKLQLYQKDLSELDEEKFKTKIEKFRKEFFSKEQIKRLHEVDEQIAREKENLDRYRAAEKKILDSKDMTQDEKNNRIKALQEKFFGQDAAAFRRREIMYGGTQR
jgi:lipase chaperone LimK